MKKIISFLLIVGVFALSSSPASAQAETKKKKKAEAMQTPAATATSPKSVIHIVTVSFKENTEQAKIQAAIDGVQKLPAKYAGITHVWTRVIKNQTDRSHIFVMEFASEQALKDYAGSPAQKEWYALYEGIRERSITSDVTN